MRNDAIFADVARSLAPASVKVVLVRGKRNKGIAGAISEIHFLKVCSTGINPARFLARDKMQTDILRLRDDTPLDDAVEIIDERDPDAVLILNAEEKFVGYLSPGDFRELELAQERIGGGRNQGPSSPPPVKFDVSHSLDLGDEFAFVRNDAVFSDASRMLAPEHVKVILVRAKKDKGIAGVLTEPEFLKVCATGINPNKTLVNKHMLTDLLRIRSDTPLDEAAKIIAEKGPDAVLVLSDENKFVGYLSPDDYNEALELLKKKKTEVFDVPAIKPEIAPPPPPPPRPSPKQEILLTSDVFDVSAIKPEIARSPTAPDGSDGSVRKADPNLTRIDLVEKAPPNECPENPGETFVTRFRIPGTDDMICTHQDGTIHRGRYVPPQRPRHQ